MKFVIGDVHGEITKLVLLVNHIFTIDKEPKFIFIGDYVDKGEDVCKVLEYLVSLSQKFDCTFLWGNHEYCWFNLQVGDDKAIEYLTKYGGLATLKSLRVNDFYSGKDKLLNNYGDFFFSLKSFWKDNSFLAVHSGIHPENYATDIDNIPLKQLLFNRFDFIGNEEKYMNKYTIIFGHTGFYTPLVSPSKIGIDTGACFLPEQPLSAFCIERMVIVNSYSQFTSLKDFKNNCCPNIIRTNPCRYDTRSN